MLYETPLSRLAIALCGKDYYSLFSNQTIMYRVIVHFIGNKIQKKDAENKIIFSCTTDDLILKIREYLNEMYNGNLSKNYDFLHYRLGETINPLPDGEKNVEKYNNSFGYNRTYLDLKDGNLRTNVNKIINNWRALPKMIINECFKYYENSEVILKRIFWILQYYITYYTKSNTLIQKNQYLDTTSEFAEFYIMSMEHKIYLLNKLKKYCKGDSLLLESIKPESLGLLQLSKILLDIVNLQVGIFHSLPDNSPEHNANIDIPDYATQLNTYQIYIDSYKKNDFSRFNVLRKYADTNFHAATELGDIYFNGEKFIFSENNQYVIQPDYKKAIEYYNLAINNSNPPYARACWSLGHIFFAGYYSEGDPNIDIENAKKYFELADNYPPALCNLAEIKIQELDNDTDGEKNFFKESDYARTLNIIYKTTKYNYFYGHNIIADFLIKHEENKKLLEDIKKRVCFPDEFDAIVQLKKSSEYSDPWAMHALAIEYIKINKFELAKKYLYKLCKLNYNKAYYSLAINFNKGNQKEKLLNKSSDYGYAPASYELALIHQANIDRCLEYLDKAEQQNLELRNVDKDLQIKISELRNKINNESI